MGTLYLIGGKLAMIGAAAVGVGSGGTTPSLLQLAQQSMGVRYYPAQHLNQDGGPGGLWTQCLAHGGGTTLPSSGVTGLTASILNSTSGGVKTNSNTLPGMIAGYMNSAGTAGTAVPLSDCLTGFQNVQSLGGICCVTWEVYSPDFPPPATPNLTGDGNEFPNVITPGTAQYNLVMYGNGGPSAPNGGVWALCQALLQLNKSVFFRTLHECNLNRTSIAWWGAGGGGPTTAQCVTLMKQIYGYMQTVMGSAYSRIVKCYSTNAQSGLYSNLDPGASYRDVFAFDRYGDTTQAQFVSSIASTVSYGAGLGIPMLAFECGVETFGSPGTYAYDGSIFDGRAQSSYPGLIGQCTFYQNWAYSYQWNWSSVQGVKMGSVPLYA